MPPVFGSPPKILKDIHDKAKIVGRQAVRNLIITLVETAPLIHPGRNLGSLCKQAKHCVRGLVFFSESSEWFELLQTPELAEVARNHPYLFQKLQRPYLNRTLNTRQRLEALRQHYRFVAACFSPAIRHEIYATPGKLLAKLSLEKVGNFGLRLSCSRQEKEGDLVIGLVNLDTGVALFTPAFSITRFETDPKEIFIGGLQGNKRANDKDLIISTTRGLHGLRPKALLLFALQQLAAIWGITRLRAVSNDMHIYRHWQKRKHLAASYDEWWIESGGQLADDGMFDLPVGLMPRNISTLKINKRQMYKRRYTMLAEIADQIRRASATPCLAADTKLLKTGTKLDVNTSLNVRRAHPHTAPDSDGGNGAPISDPAR
jgi:hypothetical protein